MPAVRVAWQQLLIFPIGGLLFVVGGCDRTEQTRPPDSGGTDEEDPPVRCARVPADSLAYAPGEGSCGFVLVGGDEPRLINLAPETAQVPVDLPPQCSEQTCDYELAVTDVGVLLVAARRGPEGEMPTWLGLGIRLEERQRFVDLWLTAGVDRDFTPAGPSHALAPHDCNGVLALFAVPRQGGARLEDTPPALLAAEGRYALGPDGLPTAAAIEREACRPLDLNLP